MRRLCDHRIRVGWDFYPPSELGWLEMRAGQAQRSSQEVHMAKSMSAGSGDEYTLRDFLTFLFKRRGLVVSSFATVLSIVILWTLLVPPTYEVTAAILLKRARAEVSFEGGANEVTEQDVNSGMHILTSRRLIEDALQALQVSEDQRPRKLFEGPRALLDTLLRRPKLTYFEELVLHLQKELVVTPLRRSNIIQISYRAKDPEWATRIVRSLTEQYVERRTAVYQSPHAASFFEQELEAAKARLSLAEEELGRFLKRAGITMMKVQEGLDSLGAQKQWAVQRLSELETQLAATETTLQEHQRMVSELEGRLASEPERLASANRLNMDPAIEEVERGLVALQLRRDSLVQDFKPESRQVQDIDTQIRLAEERLREVGRRAGMVDQTEMNPVHQAIKTDLLRAQADLEGTRARRVSLQKQVVSFRRTLDKLNENSLALEKLYREVKSAEDTYLLYRKKNQEARISAAMDQEKIVNVSIAQPAERPLRPVAPKKTINLMVGLFLGTLVALGLAFFVEYFDHGFTTGSDLERRLGVTHLASIRDERAA